MAKRASPGEKPYRPLIDADAVNAALSLAAPSAASTPAPSARVLAMPRPEPVRRPEQELPAPIRREEVEVDSHVATHALVEKFDQVKKVLFTRSESQAIDRLVISLATRLNAQVKVSHVMRALVGLLLNAESEIDRRAGETGPLTRPANGDAQALEQFEREIGKIIAAAIRDAGPVR